MGRVLGWSDFNLKNYLKQDGIEELPLKDVLLVAQKAKAA